MTEQTKRVSDCILMILRGVEVTVHTVYDRYIVVNYQGFIAPDVLRPILQSVCEGMILVLLHNATRYDASFAINCALAAAKGHRVNDIDY